jgi:ketosteroid isomerase-like protein
MEQSDDGDDVSTIAGLIARQFASVSWSRSVPADWQAFAADFFQGASLYPAARPARRQTVEGFIERMKGLAATKLRSFEETVVGADIQVFGNVAVALAACEISENDAKVSRGVEALLLIKDDGRWQIVSQTWDMASEANPLPERLAGGGTRVEVAERRP